MKSFWAGLALVALAGSSARAGNSYVTPDGINRAPATILYCVISGNTIGPCGTQANPVVTMAVPAGGALTSRTSAIAAGTSVTLFPANAQRRYLALQVPLTSGVWINPIGGIAAPNAADCIWFSAGTFYETGSFVNRGAITIYAPVALTISAWEG